MLGTSVSGWKITKLDLVYDRKVGGFFRSTLILDNLPQKVEDYDDLESHMVEHSFICKPLIVSTQKKFKNPCNDRILKQKKHIQGLWDFTHAAEVS